MGWGCEGGDVVKGNVHKFVARSRGPVSMVLFCLLTAQESAVKVTVYPASQSWLVEMRDTVVRPGTMWAVFASGDRPGRLRVAICVDLRVLSSGRVMVIGTGSSRLLRTGAVSVTKWPVVLESLIANVDSAGGGVGSSSSGSSSCARSAKGFGEVNLGVGVIGEGRKQCCLVVSVNPSSNAPAHQASWSGVGFVGMIVLCFPIQEHWCPMASYCATFCFVHPV